MQLDLCTGALDGLAQGGELLVVAPLQGDGAAGDGELLLQLQERRDELLRLMYHDIAVGPQERLALRTVYNQVFDGSPQLGVGGEPGAAAAHHAGGGNLFCDVHGSDLSP